MIKEILILVLIIEGSCILGRLVFGSMKNIYNKNKRRLRIRIHHGYLGVLLILIYLIYPKNVLLIAGMSLVISDLVHHFIVLPLWIGKTEFP